MLPQLVCKYFCLQAVKYLQTCQINRPRSGGRQFSAAAVIFFTRAKTHDSLIIELKANHQELPLSKTFFTMPPFSATDFTTSSSLQVIEPHYEYKGSSSPSSEHIFSPMNKYPISPISERFVSFNDASMIQVFEVPNMEEYSDQERMKTWYNDSELASIRREAISMTRRITRKSLRYDDCARGLEAQTGAGFLKARKSRMMALYAVLEEQHQQFLHGVQDPTQIRNLYYPITDHPRKEAIDVAIEDQVDAQIYQEEEGSEASSSMMCDFDCLWFSPSTWFGPLLVQSAIVDSGAQALA
jgi:hypothetical protein